jgi:hypothetical protein
MPKQRDGWESLVFFLELPLATQIRHQAVDERRPYGEVVAELVREALAARGARRTEARQEAPAVAAEGEPRRCEVCKQLFRSKSKVAATCSPRCRIKRDSVKRRERKAKGAPGR